MLSTYYPHRGKKIYNWSSDLCSKTLEQARDLAKHPKIACPVALMPDAHLGMDMPIGGVIAVRDAVIPAAVGADIGCGVLLWKTNLKRKHLDTATLEIIQRDVYKRIPVGSRWNPFECDDKLMPESNPLTRDRPLYRDKLAVFPVVFQNYSNATKQLGTLGGGNHFLEIQVDSEDCLWFICHTGSRNVGKVIAEHYIKAATIRSGLDKLAFFEKGDSLFDSYLNEHKYAADFARINRKRIVGKLLSIVKKHVKHCKLTPRFVDTTHNYVERVLVDDVPAYLHRKGAVSAQRGEVLVIPGTCGTPTYVCVGKGNTLGYNSCAHGAGRLLSRAEAKKTLIYKEERKKLRGVVHSLVSNQKLDEACGAYKDIDAVIANQLDLVKPLFKLIPLMTVKGA